jgi:hypothetical protein
MTESASPTAAETPRTMSARAWIATTLGVVAVVVGLNLLLAWRLDIFGLLRDPRGRELANSRHERKAKYLLNFNYVPENFDALVIGASSSENWRLEGLSQYRFYNESMLGANGTEERMLIEKALEKGHYKVALVGIALALTDRHDLQDGLDQVDPREALGSFYSYVMILDRLHDRLLHRKSDFFPDGSWVFPPHKLTPPDPNVHFARNPKDPKAAEDYRIMIEELMAHGTRVIYVVTPHYGLDAGGARQVFADNVRDFLATNPPAPLIDLNDDRFAAIHDNPEYFIDEDHLSPAGVPVVSKIVVQQMHEALHDQ